MTAFLNHFAFEFRTGIRNRHFLNYMFPLLFYLMMGFIMIDINPLFLETVVPSMVVFAIMAALLMGIPAYVVTAREAGIFRSYYINGVPSGSILAVPSLTACIHLLIVSAIITGTAALRCPLPRALAELPACRAGHAGRHDWHQRAHRRDLAEHELPGDALPDHLHPLDARRRRDVAL